ncbi:MAG: redoxin domain-containing protein [Rhodocyclaceae bacterium]|nr:redoxin domain-containing protein [Rhodocyclaceae bacterium]
MIAKHLAAWRSALTDPRRWRRWAIEAALLLALIAAVTLWQNRGLPEGAAPPLAGRQSDGRLVEVGPGQTAQLIVFWASGCPVCRAEEGNLETIARHWPVVSVAMQSGDATAVANYLRSRGLTLPAIIDETGASAENWRVRATPTHFVLDPAGNIRFRVVGYATTLGLAARLWWATHVPA